MSLGSIFCNEEAVMVAVKKTGTRTRGLVCFVSAVLLMFVTGCSGSKSAEKTKEILIGSIHPMSGGMAYEGNQIIDAQKMAIDEINAAGGIKSLGGVTLKLITGDSQGKADIAATEAQRLIQQGALVLTGTFSSSNTQTATQEAEKAKTPFVITVAASNALMIRNFKYSFRIQPNTDTFTQDFIDYLTKIKTDDIKTMVVIHENSLYGTSIYDYLKAHNTTGAELLDEIAYASTTTSLSSEVTRIQSLNPDLLVCIGYNQDQTLLYKEILQRNLTFKGIIGIANGGFSDPAFIRNFGTSADGVMDINYRWNPKSQLAQNMLANFKTKYNADMSPHAIFGYTSVYVIADALERAASTNKDKIRDALAATSLSAHVLPQGVIAFDAKGENKNAAAVLTQIQNGQSAVVFPKEYANADLIFPLK